MSRFDQIYRSLLLTKFFTKGWGKPEHLKRLFEFRKILSNRETCSKLVPDDYPVYIDKDKVDREERIVEGHFLSPFVHQVPGVMPKEVEVARFQMILPTKWSSNSFKGRHKPVLLQLAGTGDHGFGRRRWTSAKPLLKEAGIASILLENPYYGTRKPKGQLRSSLHNVSDLFVMGGALVLESLALFHWCEREGYGPLGITGVSMGGHMASAAATNWHKPLSVVPFLSWSTASNCYTQMASLAATNWHKPIPLVPCLSWSTASATFTQGVMSGAIPWKLLQRQYFSDSVYEDELIHHIESPEANFKNKSFQLGIEFSQNFDQNMTELNSFQHFNNLQGSRELLPDYKPDSASQHGPTTSEAHGKLNNSGAGGDFQVMSSNVQLRNSMYAAAMSALSQTSMAISKKLRQQRTSPLKEEVLHFMRGVMDECTHLGNFSVPVDPSLIIIVAAEYDSYIPRKDILGLDELWPGAEVRYIKDQGHIQAYLQNQQEFRNAIKDAFDRQIQKYYS